MAKITLLVLLIASLALNVVFYLNGSEKQVKEPFRIKDDNRKSLVLEEKYRQHVLAEMRGFVKSMALIQEGILKNDPGLVVEGGEQSGHSAKPPKALREALTDQFLKMGMGTHQLFDAIADSARENFNPETTSNQLYILTTRCNTCHDTFRLDPKF